MGSFSIWHWIVVFLVVMLLFGRGRFSSMMGDVAEGIKSFKKGMAEDDNAPPRQIGRETPKQNIGLDPSQGATRVSVSEPEPDADRRA